jgi:hypothetical protein
MQKLFFFTAVASLVALAGVAATSCTHGSYDGSFEAGPDTGGGDASEDSGVISVTEKTIDPTKDEVISTPEGAFDLTVPAGAYDAPTKITITRIADRTVETLIVPVFVVSAPKDPALPVQAQFKGNNSNGGVVGRALLVEMEDVSGAGFKPAPFVGGNLTGGGGQTLVWALTRRLGSFSLGFESYSSSNGFTDVNPTSCLAACCKSTNGNGTGPLNAIGGSCVCDGNADLACYLRNCTSVADAIQRCVEIAGTRPPSVSCNSSAPVPQCMGGLVCGYPGTCGGSMACCINNHAGQCVSGSGGPPGGSSCAGIAVRCDLQTKCPTGTKCCVFDNEAYCASTCPNERTWCNTQADCDGGVGGAGPGVDAGPCREARGCPHGTCGEPPTGCTN